MSNIMFGLWGETINDWEYREFSHTSCDFSTLLNGKLSHYRVMTVSFHKYGDLFFPGTGDAKVIVFILFVSLVVPSVCSIRLSQPYYYININILNLDFTVAHVVICWMECSMLSEKLFKYSIDWNDLNWFYHIKGNRRKRRKVLCDKCPTEGWNRWP